MRRHLLIAILLMTGTTLLMVSLFGCGVNSDPSLDLSLLDKVDSDGDGLSDAEELFLGTDPNKLDSDGDGFNDDKDSDTYFNDDGSAKSNDLLGFGVLAALMGMLGNGASTAVYGTTSSSDGTSSSSGGANSLEHAFFSFNRTPPDAKASASNGDLHILVSWTDKNGEQQSYERISTGTDLDGDPKDASPTGLFEWGKTTVLIASNSSVDPLLYDAFLTSAEGGSLPEISSVSYTLKDSVADTDPKSAAQLEDETDCKPDEIFSAVELVINGVAADAKTTWSREIDLDLCATAPDQVSHNLAGLWCRVPSGNPLDCPKI